MKPLALSVRDAAREVGLDPTTLYAAIHKGELPAKRNGRKLLVKVSDLEDWFDALPDATEDGVA